MPYIFNVNTDFIVVPYSGFRSDRSIGRQSSVRWFSDKDGLVIPVDLRICVRLVRCVLDVGLISPVQSDLPPELCLVSPVDPGGLVCLVALRSGVRWIPVLVQ